MANPNPTSLNTKAFLIQKEIDLIDKLKIAIAALDDIFKDDYQTILLDIKVFKDNTTQHLEEIGNFYKNFKNKIYDENGKNIIIAQTKLNVENTIQSLLSLALPVVPTTAAKGVPAVPAQPLNQAEIKQQIQSIIKNTNQTLKLLESQYNQSKDKNAKDQAVKKILDENSSSKVSKKIIESLEGQITNSKDLKDLINISLDASKNSFSLSINNSLLRNNPSSKIILDTLDLIHQVRDESILENLRDDEIKYSYEDFAENEVNKRDAFSNYYREILFTKDGSGKEDLVQAIFLEKNLIDKYFEYLKKDLYLSGEITVGSDKITGMNFLLERQKEFNEAWAAFQKEAKDSKSFAKVVSTENSVTSIADNSFTIALEKFKISYKNTIQNIESNLLDRQNDLKNSFNKLSIDIKDSKDKTMQEDMAKILAKKNIFYRAADSFSKNASYYTGIRYQSKLENALATIESKDGLKTTVDMQELELKSITDGLNKDKKSLLIDVKFDSNKNKSISFDVNKLLRSTESTVQFSSSPVYLKFDDSTSTSADKDHYVKISSKAIKQKMPDGTEKQVNQKNIEIFGSGMFVEITDKKIPDLSVLGLKSIFIMENSKGKLSFYDKNNTLIVNQGIINLILNLEKNELVVNGQDVRGIATEFILELQSNSQSANLSGVKIGARQVGEGRGS